MDGARLWESLPFYQNDGGASRSAADVCAPFDSVYVSFYKGLGGMTGAMLVGSDDMIAEARVSSQEIPPKMFHFQFQVHTDEADSVKPKTMM